MKTILIVEDEFRTREGLSNLITKVDMGCRVVGEAENGYEGLKLIQCLQPDIVITDIQMPKFDGLDMVRKAKEMGAHSTFIILSGYATFEYAQQGIKLGVMEYLLKPITISAVKELLINLTETKNTGNAIQQEQMNYSPLVKEMVAIINENYGMHLCLDNFAERFKLTTQYISNMFTKETGTTFSNYVKQIRIEKAKDLILNTDMKIYEIACNVGYPDQKYFSKVFKEYTGVSAKQFAFEVNKK